MSSLRADRAEMYRWLALLCERGDVYELRILNSRFGTVSGYYDDFNKLAEHAAEAAEKLLPEGIYTTLNQVRCNLLARSANTVRKYAKHVTADVDILRRRWLPVDVDPARPSGISSTDEEHELALGRARRIHEFLASLG
jgi:hypothetical protein